MVKLEIKSAVFLLESVCGDARVYLISGVC